MFILFITWTTNLILLFILYSCELIAYLFYTITNYYICTLLFYFICNFLVIVFLFRLHAKSMCIAELDAEDICMLCNLNISIKKRHILESRLDNWHQLKSLHKRSVKFLNGCDQQKYFYQEDSLILFLVSRFIHGLLEWHLIFIDLIKYYRYATIFL